MLRVYTGVHTLSRRVRAAVQSEEEALLDGFESLFLPPESPPDEPGEPDESPEDDEPESEEEPEEEPESPPEPDSFEAAAAACLALLPERVP